MKKASALLMVIIAGCAPSQSGWRVGMNGAIGRNFDDLLSQRCRPDCTSLWSPGNDDKTVERVIEEPSGNRNYIYWGKFCKYSLLVSREGIVISWRYEPGNIDGCYVF